jgi:chemotaxis protein histidine kinase CheA
MFNLFGPQPSMYYPRQQYIRQPYRNYNPWDDDEDEDTYMAPSYGLSRRSPPRVQKRSPQSSIRVVPHDEHMTSRSRNQQMKKPVEQVHPFFGRHHAQQYDSESDEEQNIHPLFSAPQRSPQRQQLRIPPQYQQRQVQPESDSESEEEEMHPLFSSPQKQAQRSPQRSPPRQQLRIPPQFQKMIQKESDEEQIPVVQKKASPNSQRTPSPKQVEQEPQEKVLEPAEEKPSTPQQVESAPQEQPVEQQPPTEPSEEDKLSEEEKELRNSLQKISTISGKVDDLEKNVVALREQCDTRPKPVEDEKYWWDIRKAEEMLTQQLLALDSVTGGDEVRKVRKEQVLRVQTLLNDVDQIRKASEPQKSE